MILVCGPSLDHDETLRSMDMLRRVDLPNATRFVVTTGKTEVEAGIRTHNVEAGYPREPLILRTQSRWAVPNEVIEPRFRDGYDLFCLRGLVRKHRAFELAVLLRNGELARDRWDELEEGLAGGLFHVFGDAASVDGEGGNVIIDLRDDRAMLFLDLVVDMYRSGAAYGHEPYSLRVALETAAQAAQMVSELNTAAPS